jgi:TonB-linked SusC/RagA family outer membrane protein
MKKLTESLSCFLFSCKNKTTKFMNIRLIASLVLVLNLFAVNLYAQTNVTGKVSDAKTGTPIPGVNIVIDGTAQGTITDINGQYSIPVPDPSSILVFSFIGYQTQKVSPAGSATVDIVLQEDAVNIDELVVIGYGTVKKSDLTGSVSVVTSEEMNRTPASNLSNAIQGKASGVLVTQSGSPGGKVNIKIRGVGSITQDPNPLIVIDGVVDADINSISPNDIESFQVLKDASAAAIYGANGSNGVIIITTKRGKSGPPKVSFSTFSSMNTIAKKFDLMDANEYAAFYTKIATDNASLPNFAYSDKFRQQYYGEGWEKGSSWQDEIVQKSFAHNYYLNVSGGGESSNFSISGGYYKEDGLLRGSGAERFNLRANSDFKVGKYIKVGESINLTRYIQTNPTSHEGDPWQLSLIASPLMRVFNADNKGGYEGPQIAFDYSDADTTVANVSNTGANDKGNPRGPLDLGSSKTFSHTISTSFYAEIKPFEWLTFRSTPSFNYNISRDNNWMPKFDMGVRSLGQAVLYSRYGDASIFSLENQLTAAKTFGKHSFTVTGVNHRRHGAYNFLSVDGKDYQYESLNVINGSDPLQRTGLGDEIPWAMDSYLARLIYDYNSFIYLTTSIRRDGSSNFLPEHRWGNFPSVSLAVKIKQLAFKNIDQISSAKLRFGYGKTGNSNVIGSSRYTSLIANQTEFTPVFGNPQTIAPAINELNSIGNPLIQWETAVMTNFGADFSFFNNSLEFSGEYYMKKNNDLLLEVPVSITLGRLGMPWVNIGKIENSGFDFDIRYRKLTGDFTYSISANLTTLKNRVVDIPSVIYNDVNNATNITRVGNTIGSFYGFVCEGIIQPGDTTDLGVYKYAKQGGSKNGDLRFKDLNRDGVISDKDRIIIGKPVPDFTYSINVELGYKNFDFSVFLFGIENYQVLNGLRRDIESFSLQDLAHNKSKDFGQNYWTPDNLSTEYIRLDQNNSNNNTRISTWWLEDASFLRIKDVQLGYTLPQAASDRIGISSLRIYTSVTNLHTFTKYTGRDPESPINSSGPLGTGLDNGAYPLPRVFNLGLQLGF